MALKQWQNERIFDVRIIIMITFYRSIMITTIAVVLHKFLCMKWFVCTHSSCIMLLRVCQFFTLTEENTFLCSLLCECLIYKHRSEAHKLDFRPPAGPTVSVKYRWSGSQPTLEILLLTQSSDCQRDYMVMRQRK